MGTMRRVKVEVFGGGLRFSAPGVAIQVRCISDGGVEEGRDER